MFAKVRKSLRHPFTKVREDFFLRKIGSGQIPRHVAVIMDGNGRWARRKSLPRIEGHRAGIETTRAIVQLAGHMKIDHLTLYTFSVENWRRPPAEVDGLMRLIELTMKNELEELNRNNVKVNVFGDIDALPHSTLDACLETTRRTKNNTGLILNIALNYGGRQEITNAFNAIVVAGQQGARRDILPEEISARLYTAGMPEPELLIRSGGEFRLSNFLLWQIAYTELWVSPVLWPDFTRVDFLKAIMSFQKRKRRFGGLEEEDLR